MCLLLNQTLLFCQNVSLNTLTIYWMEICQLLNEKMTNTLHQNMQILLDFFFSVLEVLKTHPGNRNLLLSLLDNIYQLINILSLALVLKLHICISHCLQLCIPAPESFLAHRRHARNIYGMRLTKYRGLQFLEEILSLDFLFQGKCFCVLFTNAKGHQYGGFDNNLS